MENLEKKETNEFGLEVTEAVSIEESFKPVIIEQNAVLKIYEELITSDITEDICERAGKLSTVLSKVNSSLIKVHKAQKDYFWSGGKFVDSIKNKNSVIIEEMQINLKALKNHFVNIKIEETKKLTEERYALCIPYVEDESLILPDLGCMHKSLWDNYIIGLKASFEAKKAEDKRIEDERIAAEKAEIERQKAIEAENLKLKKEAESNAKKQEVDRLERERLAKIEADKQAKIEADRLVKEAEEKRLHEVALKKEREEKERLENEIKAKQEAEQKAIEEAEALKQAELNKGDADKISDLIKDLSELKTKYSFKSAKNVKMYNQVNELLDKVINHINK